MRVDETHSKTLELQPDTKVVAAESYSLSQLLSYHDQVFVKNLYLAVLGREATPVEFDRTLGELRSGSSNKIELIEALLNSNGISYSKVTGLPSATSRRVAAWPVVGYCLRIVRAISRLPQLMQDQQRFEAYALGQQQRIADFINQEVPVVGIGKDSTGDPSSFAVTINDCIQGVLMLADSVVELTEKQQEQKVALTTAIQQVQTQLEASERQLHETLVAVTEEIRDMQLHLATLREEVDKKLDSPKEFLVQEQRVIVEAQKLALQDIEERFNQTIQAEVHSLNKTLEQLKIEIATRVPAQESTTAPELERA